MSWTCDECSAPTIARGRAIRALLLFRFFSFHFVAGCAALVSSKHEYYSKGALSAAHGAGDPDQLFVATERPSVCWGCGVNALEWRPARHAGLCVIAKSGKSPPMPVPCPKQHPRAPQAHPRTSPDLERPVRELVVPVGDTVAAGVGGRGGSPSAIIWQLSKEIEI